MDKAPYEFDAIFLNRLSDIACLTAVTEITCFGHYVLVCEFMDLIGIFITEL